MLVAVLSIGDALAFESPIRPVDEVLRELRFAGISVSVNAG
jgi:hypothetical protein